MEINELYKNKCWTCGEEHKEELLGWKQCQGCKVWNCPECLESLLTFFLSYCNRCNKQYCNLCDKDGFCPDCLAVGDLIYAYTEDYDKDDRVRIDGFWYYKKDIPDFLDELERSRKVRLFSISKNKAE